MKMYYDADADLGLLKGKKVAIIGFGSQGHAQALNLRDSGVDVLVSEVPSSPNYALAVKYGFKPVSAAEAATQAQVVQILTQDHVQAMLYENDLKPHMAKGKTLLFSHGFNIHYGQIVPTAEIDVIMVAPYHLDEVKDRLRPGGVRLDPHLDVWGADPNQLPPHLEIFLDPPLTLVPRWEPLRCPRTNGIEPIFHEDNNRTVIAERIPRGPLVWQRSRLRNPPSIVLPREAE